MKKLKKKKVENCFLTNHSKQTRGTYLGNKAVQLVYPQNLANWQKIPPKVAKSNKL